MPQVTLPNTIATGQQRSAAAVQANDAALRDGVNSLDDDKVSGAGFSSVALADPLVVQLGLNKAATVRRGKTNIATQESVTSTVYTTLPTPDRVQGLVHPGDGLLFVAFQGTWANSVTGTGRAAIFLNNNQAGIEALPSPIPSEAIGSSAGTNFVPLSTYHAGMNSDNGSASAYTGDLTTGQIVATYSSGGPAVGGACLIFAAAGTYDVSIRFKSSSGFVTVKNRRLWAKTEGY